MPRIDLTTISASYSISCEHRTIKHKVRSAIFGHQVRRRVEALRGEELKATFRIIERLIAPQRPDPGFVGYVDTSKVLLPFQFHETWIPGIGTDGGDGEHLDPVDILGIVAEVSVISYCILEQLGYLSAQFIPFHRSTPTMPTALLPMKFAG